MTHEEYDKEWDELTDECFECTGLGDDWYYDNETDDIVCACDDCYVHKRFEDLTEWLIYAGDEDEVEE